MSGLQPVADLEGRRLARQRRSGDHRTRLDYDTHLELLEDVDRVIDDLAAIGGEQILISANDLDFTVRRLRVLIRGAVARLREEGD